jgi:CDP-diacylglycerol--serine O-phosphatidyltransferase
MSKSYNSDPINNPINKESGPKDKVVELKSEENAEIPQEQYPRHRGVYLLPNLFTTAALFAGFYAVVAGMKGLFEYSAIAIFVAMIMDTLDGRVARLTKTQSAFGAQYDSLSDMVSFGIAPALVSYNWGLSELGKPGWLAAFIFAATGALRLARFNVQSTVVDKRYFIGLPIPAAAAVVAGMIWLGTEFNISGKNISILVAFMVSALGFLMVSYFKYYSFKEIDFKNHVPYMAVLVIILLFSLIAWNPPIVLFTVFFGYALSGPALWFKHRIRTGAQTHITPDTSDTPGVPDGADRADRAGMKTADKSDQPDH